VPDPAARLGREAWCLYPFELDGPIVLVMRDHLWTLEDEIEAAVERFGGRFAGT